MTFMSGNIIVTLGSRRLDLSPLHAVAREFGWKVEIAGDLTAIAAGIVCPGTAAVLFHREALRPGCSWLDAIRLVGLALPGVRAIACHGFSESVDWPELCDAGAFHTLWLPLRENEVRQSLGFLVKPQKRSSSATQMVSEAIAVGSTRQIRRMIEEQSHPARAAA